VEKRNRKIRTKAKKNGRAKKRALYCVRLQFLSKLSKKKATTAKNNNITIKRYWEKNEKNRGRKMNGPSKDGTKMYRHRQQNPKKRGKKEKKGFLLYMYL
jgi:hypothetical protein